MKFIIAIFLFILVIGITFKSVAAETETCTSDKQENCTKSKAVDHGKIKSHGGAKEERLNEKMNSLFPEKQPNSAVSAVPETVKLTSPKFLSQVLAGSVKLEWSPIAGATNYHVQVATDPNFKWLVSNDQWVKTNSFEASQLEAGKKYYWRVAAVKSQNDAMYTKSLFVSSVFATK